MHWVIAGLVAKYLIKPRYKFVNWLDKSHHKKLTKYILGNPRAWKHIKKLYFGNKINGLANPEIERLCTNPDPEIIKLLIKFPRVNKAIKHIKAINSGYFFHILRGLLENPACELVEPYITDIAKNIIKLMKVLSNIERIHNTNPYFASKLIFQNYSFVPDLVELLEIFRYDPDTYNHMVDLMCYNSKEQVVKYIIDNFITKMSEKQIQMFNKNPSDIALEFLNSHPEYIRSDYLIKNSNPKALLILKTHNLLNISDFVNLINISPDTLGVLIDNMGLSFDSIAKTIGCVSVFNKSEKIFEHIDKITNYNSLDRNPSPKLIEWLGNNKDKISYELDTYFNKFDTKCYISNVARYNMNLLKPINLNKIGAKILNLL